MLAALVEIPYYEQLRKADPATLQAVRSALDALPAGTVGLRSEHRGRFLYVLPQQPPAALSGALTRLKTLRRALDGAEVFDAVLLVYLSAAEDAGADQEAEALLARLEATGRTPARGAVAIQRSAADALGGSVSLTGEGEFPVLESVSLSPASAPVAPPAPERDLSRPQITGRIVDAVFAVLQDEAPRRPIVVLGPDGVGKRRATREAMRIVVGESAWRDVLVIHPLYNRKSAIHPFLNSFRADVLERVPRHLAGWERPVWASKGALLGALLGQEVTGGPAASVCPDRLTADFGSLYRLYALAYVRWMTERGLSAPVVFENLHAFHPEALQYCVALVADLRSLPAFVAVATCRAGHDASAVFGTDFTAVSVHPVTLDEIRHAADSLYPGVRLPEKALRRIRAQTGAQIGPVRHVLRHLQRSGKIEPDGNRAFRWVTGIPARIPGSPAAGAWEEIEALSPACRQVLYLCGLAGGVLSAPGIVDLALSIPVEGADEGRKAVRSHLQVLAETGLIRSPDEPHLLQPRLKTRLGTALGAWSHRAKSALAASLEDAWRAGRSRRLVLIYAVLRTERPGVALEVLRDLVIQKLDELNLKGCHFFLDPAKLRVEESSPGFDRARFDRLARMGELRSSLLQGAWQRAEAAMDAVTNLEIPDAAFGEQGQRALEQARFHLVKGDGPAAAKASKAAVILFHEAGDEAGERRAECELGASRLAEGRLEEAGEYFGFVVRSAASPAFPRVRAAALGTVASYLQGSYSASVRMAEEGIRLAAEAGRREWEAFLIFLRARQRFDLGQFDEAIVALERLGCFARVYGMRRASRIATLWRARCLCHAGDGEQAERHWALLGDSEEVRFFHAEGLYLRGLVGAALELLAPVEGARRRGGLDPGERVSWDTGYASVEERCVALRRDGGTVSRLLRGFRAYLTALDGRPEQAMRELYRITREERVTELDPYLPLYSYWYAATLPEEGGEGTDHKLTVLNRAMKHLQQRSSRIENARDRSQLMTANYWNARLLEEGRARHLV